MQQLHRKVENQQVSFIKKKIFLQTWKSLILLMFESVVEILPQRELGRRTDILQGKQIHLLQFRKPPTSHFKVSEFLNSALTSWHICFLVNCKAMFIVYLINDITRSLRTCHEVVTSARGPGHVILRKKKSSSFHRVPFCFFPVPQSLLCYYSEEARSHRSDKCF